MFLNVGDRGTLPQPVCDAHACHVPDSLAEDSAPAFSESWRKAGGRNGDFIGRPAGCLVWADPATVRPAGLDAGLEWTCLCLVQGFMGSLGMHGECVELIDIFIYPFIVRVSAHLTVDSCNKPSRPDCGL